MQAQFTSGSVVRHLIRVTLANSIGLLSLYVVDILAMYWLSKAQDGNILAAVGLVSILQFLVISICLGLSSAMMTLISRHVGASNLQSAQAVAASSLLVMLVLVSAIAMLFVFFGDYWLTALGARDSVLELANRYLLTLVPGFVLMALGQVCIYVLLAHGQSTRAMAVVLSGTCVVAALDPIFIVQFEWGLDGVAASYAITRFLGLVFGLFFIFKLRLVKVIRPFDSLAQLRTVLALAVPIVISNIAPGVAAAFVISQFAVYGPEVLAGVTVIDRILQFTFGAFFALPGAIAPVLGQNLGAQLFERVLSTIRWGAVLVLVFGSCVSLLLIVLSGWLTSLFHLDSVGQDLVLLFCLVGGAGWTLIGLQFVALPTFIVMRKPVFSALANWARATVGTVPFVLMGAVFWGAQGVLVGQIAGNAIVAVAVFWMCLFFVKRQTAKMKA